MTASFSLDDVDLVRLDILASRLASLLKAGDVIALSGPLGAGKTTFARALVTRLDGEGEVPSPTFALMQRYETPRLTLTHCDFYRLEPAELDELGLDDALSEGAVLIEWPERAAGWLPADRLDIAMDETATPNERRIVLTGHGGWEPRLERLEQMASFLDRTPYAAAPARYLQGDASTRSYARLVLPDRAAILMNSPRQPDGPPIRDGKPYSALVHLAEDVTPFVAVAGGTAGTRPFGAGRLRLRPRPRLSHSRRPRRQGVRQRGARAGARWASCGARRSTCSPRSRTGRLPSSCRSKATRLTGCPLSMPRRC